MSNANRNTPSWATVVSAVALVAVLFLGAWCFLLTQSLETERVYRANTREKLVEMLTLIKTNSKDEQLRETAEELLRELQEESRP